ncbi:hypothetical protein NSK_003422 [Nannochloropsis salina CCMP1776]|uniref:SET domain-containing protein n=1 Tax=Nannochloropsis salina CCMP1776 TaxID=1027361 RepID=A0A4D9D8M2_9STRA|nr:hypothetical protein NSK_003422 [Nannochloropsis salina CCMP1776]|eukprot:TFJ84998.1 hypothetical protein NSK_003422 [Nannochloropsis salina CCMP1776]
MLPFEPGRALGKSSPHLSTGTYLVKAHPGGGQRSSKEKGRRRGRNGDLSTTSSPSFPSLTRAAREVFPPYGEEHVQVEERLKKKPTHWPSEVFFSQKLKWAASSAGQDVKEVFRRRLLPGIEVRRITEPSHVLHGQYGVYATRAFAPFDVIGEYVGRVVPPAVCGEYVASIDQDDGRLPQGSSPWGVDSALYGNEVRMINHFHQIGPVPNVKFVTAYIAELPHILVVVLRPIAEGAEILIDYGADYWCGRDHPPPPEPLGIDDGLDADVLVDG